MIQIKNEFYEQGQSDCKAGRLPSKSDCHFGEYRRGYQEQAERMGVHLDWELYWDSEVSRSREQLRSIIALARKTRVRANNALADYRQNYYDKEPTF